MKFLVLVLGFQNLGTVAIPDFLFQKDYGSSDSSLSSKGNPTLGQPVPVNTASNVDALSLSYLPVLSFVISYLIIG